MKKLSWLLVLAVALIPTLGVAKEGWYFGAFYPQTTLTGGLPNTVDQGDGMGVRIGSAGKYMAIELTFFKTTHDADANPKMDFKGGTLDFKLNLPLTGINVEPYILGGWGKYSLENSLVTYRGNVHQVFRLTDDITGEVHDGDFSFFNGGQFGFGMDAYLTPELSLNIGWTKRSMFFDYGTPGNAEWHVHSRTVEIGLTYHFL